MTVRQFLVCFSLVTGLLIGFAAPSAGYALQDDSSTAIDSGTPEAPVDGSGAELDPTEISTTEVEPTEVATVPADLPTAEPTTESSAPSLAVNPDRAPVCTPLPDQPDALALGGILDYACVWNVGVSLSGVEPATVGLDWSVTAAARDGWSVRLLPPGHDPAIDTDWTDPLSAPVTFTQPSTLTATPETDDTGTMRYAEPLRFLARVTRLGCDSQPKPITLELAVSVSAPDVDGASAFVPDPSAEKPFIDPTLAPAPDPILSLSGGLDFGSVGIDADGIQTQPEPQILTVAVDGLDKTCGTWAVGLRATSLEGEDGHALTSNRLTLVAINGVEVPDGCALGDGCAVVKIASGPDAAASATFELSIALVLPDEATITTFSSSVTATISYNEP